VRVGVGVDETGMDQPARRSDFLGTLRRWAAGRAQFADRIVLDQDVREIGFALGDIEHPPAAQDRIGHRRLPPLS
jgi:hypothetical protein